MGTKTNRLHSYTSFIIDVKQIRKSFDESFKETMESRHVQRDEMNTKTLRRFGRLIKGALSAAFSNIMDILTSGYGKLDVDNDASLHYVDMISTFDLKLMHKKKRYKNSVSRQISQISIFLASCLFLDANSFFGFCFENRPYVFFIGRDNSPLKKLLKQIKIFDYQIYCMTQQDV